ncbi:RNA polymerase sigma factor [Spirosoma knui]
MKQFSDEELVRLYLETQRNQYFESLYERYCDKVYRKCLSFSKDPVQAEDYTHDVFLKLVTKLGSFREQAKFSTWLYTLTYNYCLDQTRASAYRREVYVDEGWDRLNVVSDDDSHAEVTELEVQHLQKAMQRLAAEERMLLLMKYQDDISIREIADLNGLTENAVKMRLKRSRDKLRKIYLEGAVFWVLLAIKAALSLRDLFR